MYFKIEERALLFQKELQDLGGSKTLLLASKGEKRSFVVLI